jgi:hypothetical protein
MSASPLPFEDAIRRDGYVFVAGARMQAELETLGVLDDWPAFAASWDALEPDLFMADGGRYRRRRHAVYATERDGAIRRQPHQAHFQALDYNPLNGGVERWFAPMLAGIGASRSLDTVLRYCRRLFSALAPALVRWKIETHQFRIEAGPQQPGQPTPEGMHRDGVDYVLVLLITRHNIASGTTGILDSERRELGSFTLTRAFDAALVDDRRVFHGVTAVQPLDPAQPAWRDVLVVTFRRADDAAAPPP